MTLLALILLTFTLSACGPSILFTPKDQKQSISDCAVAKLSWTNPTTRSDGSELNNISHFVIAVRMDGDVDHYLEIRADYNPNSDAGAYQVASLRSGLNFFKIKTVDTTGQESVWSNEVSKTMCESAGGAELVFEAKN